MKTVVKKVTALAAAAALIGSAMAQDFVVGITFDAGGKFDASFNEGTWNGLIRAVDELSATYEIDILEYEPSAGGQTADGQRRMAGEQGRSEERRVGTEGKDLGWRRTGRERRQERR